MALQTTPKRTVEPFVWLLFSGGGMVAALTLPVLLVLFVAFGFGWVTPPDHADLLAVLRNPLVRLGLLVVCAMSLVHAAHRFRFTLQDGLQLQRFEVPIAVVCYGAALAGSVAAGYLLLAGL